MMQMRIHILHTGEVCVASDLPFGGEHCNLLKASGLTTKKKNRLWLPVSAYLIEHPQGRILVDCGWHRAMSPTGEFDKKAQIKALGSRLLYAVNQGKLELGDSVDEQLRQRGIKPAELKYVLLTHLDCDHANGLMQVAEAKHILVARDELRCARRNGLIRYQKQWWEHADVTAFDWKDHEGPAGKSYDLFGDGSIQLINIPGHSDGLFAVKVVNTKGQYVLLYSDGGYAAKSWQEMILPGIALDKVKQRQSLEWIREQSLDKNCVISIANHDPAVAPQVIGL